MRHYRHISRAARSGTTIVELLAVMATISVLLTILLPVISRTRQASLFVVCKNNLRQIGTALQMYANDNRDYYPDAYTLGGAYFRRAPGERNPADPTSVPERYGLPAVLQEAGYLRPVKSTWICPAAPEWMKEYKNTYSWALFWDAQSSMKSFERSQPKYANTFLVFDDFANSPYFPGIRRGRTDPNPTVPINRASLPHAYRISQQSGSVNPNDRRGALGVLYLNGSVGAALYAANPRYPTAGPTMIPIQGE